MKKICISVFTLFLLTAILFAVPVSAAKTETEGDWYARMEALYLRENTGAESLPAYAEEMYRWLIEQSSKEDGVLVSIGDNAAEYKSVRDNKTMWSYPVHTLTFFDLYGMSTEEIVAKLSRAAAPVIQLAENVLNAFRKDYPEIYWLNNQTRFDPLILITTSAGKTQAEITVSLTLKVDSPNAYECYDIRTDTSPDYDAAAERASAVLAAIGIADTSSDREKIRALNTWLTKNNGYSTASVFTDVHRNPLTALNGQSGENGPVCEGYAKAFKILCDQLDIPCVLITGDATNSLGQTGAHMWNAVKMKDGKWYGVDVTWNDPVVQGDESRPVSGSESEEYLLVGRDKLTSHVSVNYTDMECTIAFADSPVLASQDYREYTVSGTIAPADIETTITVLNRDGETVGSVTAVGRYTLSLDVEPGEYTLKVERPKYVTRTYTITLGGN